jgi:hypothetical protein
MAYLLLRDLAVSYEQIADFSKTMSTNSAAFVGRLEAHLGVEPGELNQWL